MQTLARTFVLDAPVGVVAHLPRAGSALEIPDVFDASAREIEALAAEGMVEVVHKRGGSAEREPFITEFAFVRLR